MDIISVNNKDEITNIFNSYSFKIEEEYKKWLTDIYIPTLNKLENDIENTEIKIAHYRNFFINIINKFPKEEIIVPVEMVTE